MQHFLRGLQRDRAAEQVGVRDQPVQRAFQLAHVGGDLVGQELHHLGRHGDAGARSPWPPGSRCAARRWWHAGRPPCRSRAGCAAGRPGRTRSDGDLSADTTICLPASTSALKVWKNSSCVLSLPMRNCRSSIISTSTLRSCSLNSHRGLAADRRDEAVHELLGRHIGHRDRLAAMRPLPLRVSHAPRRWRASGGSCPGRRRRTGTAD